MEELRDALKTQSVFPYSERSQAWLDARYGNLNRVPKIDEGVQGEVYRCFDYTEEIDVAIKVSAVEESWQRESVQREVAALRKLVDCPYIVRAMALYYCDAYGYNPDETFPRVFMAMRLEGTKFQVVLNKHAGEGRALAKPTVVRYMHDLLSALIYCHGNDIVHCDVKPDNLLIAQDDGRLILADFGSSHRLNEQIAVGEVVVPMGFRSPELLLGHRKIGVYVDVWSAGVVFMQMINNRLPFAASNPYDQVLRIFKTLGTPFDDEYIRMCPLWSNLFPRFELDSTFFASADACGLGEIGRDALKLGYRDRAKPSALLEKLRALPSD